MLRFAFALLLTEISTSRSGSDPAFDTVVQFIFVAVLKICCQDLVLSNSYASVSLKILAQQLISGAERPY